MPKIDPKKRISDLSADEVSKIAAELKSITIEGDLVRVVRGNIQRLQVIGSYRGMRHSRNLPSRGQRTRTNARTKRGKRKTVGAFKKEMLAKRQLLKQRIQKRNQKNKWRLNKKIQEKNQNLEKCLFQHLLITL